CSEGEAVKQPAHRGLSRWGIIGLLTGISLYTYPAARLLPILLIVLAVYLLIFHRRVFMQNWVGMAVAMVLTAVLALPLGVAIAQGTSEAAVEGIGADARLAELAVPIHDLASGNPQTLLQYTWSTLGMFHATGDPEWLYNIPHRPVFNILGGLLFWCSVALSVLRWKQPRFFGLLAWLGLGLAPAFVSVPPASLSHTILILPIVYILPAIIFSELLARAPRIRLPGRVWLYGATAILLGLFLTTNSYRDLHDYFSVWPERGMVRFLYRGEYRDVAQYLNAHPDVREVGVASRLMGPWDRVALDVDLRNQETGIRLFNPERAIVIPAAQTDSSVVLIVPDSLVLHDQLANTVNRATSAAPSATGSFGLFTVGRPNDVGDLLPWSTVAVDQRFANGLALSSWGVSVAAPSVDGGMEDLTLTLYTEWEVWRALELPNVPLIANPPPPGVYSGPRLSVSVHLVTDDGTFVSGDDGLWVDPLTLRPGDRILQVHVLEIPDSLEAGTSIEIGLYDPMTGEQWETLGGDSSADRVLIPIEVDG
ncbi:MAG: hypothetical protein GX620_16035, partial [Chloroflexi bacterium]|nr:hypothetical protein [Chloroflexota bacterium]